MKDPNSASKLHLKEYYTIFLETGMILTLLLFIALTNINIQPAYHSDDITFNSREVVEMEEIVATKQPEKPPLPPRPAVPVEVPNNEIIEDEVLAIDAEIYFDQPLEIPPPPAEKQAEIEESEEDFFVVVEEMPKLLGGIESLQKEIKYPEKAKKANIEGLVIIQFVVNEKGEVENPRVIRGIGGGCDEEALRVAKLATFTPGKQRGVPVRVQYSVPIFFKLRT